MLVLAWLSSPYIVLLALTNIAERWMAGRLAGQTALVFSLIFLLWTVFVFGMGATENADQPPPFGFDFQLVLVFAPLYQLPVALICGMVCLFVALLARIRAKPTWGGKT